MDSSGLRCSVRVHRALLLSLLLLKELFDRGHGGQTEGRVIVNSHSECALNRRDNANVPEAVPAMISVHPGLLRQRFPFTTKRGRDHISRVEGPGTRGHRSISR